MSKHCPRCDMTKALTAFPLNKTRSDGLGSWCKLCNSKAIRDRRYARKQAEKAAASAHTDQLALDFGE